MAAWRTVAMSATMKIRDRMPEFRGGDRAGCFPTARVAGLFFLPACPPASVREYVDRKAHDVRIMDYHG